MLPINMQIYVLPPSWNKTYQWPDNDNDNIDGAGNDDDYYNDAFDDDDELFTLLSEDIKPLQDQMDIQLKTATYI